MGSLICQDIVAFNSKCCKKYITIYFNQAERSYLVLSTWRFPTANQNTGFTPVVYHGQHNLLCLGAGLKDLRQKSFESITILIFLVQRPGTEPGTFSMQTRCSATKTCLTTPIWLLYIMWQSISCKWWGHQTWITNLPCLKSWPHFQVGHKLLWT